MAAKPPPPPVDITGFLGAVVVEGFEAGFGAGFGAGLGVGFGAGFAGGGLVFFMVLVAGFGAEGLGGSFLTWVDAEDEGAFFMAFLLAMIIAIMLLPVLAEEDELEVF
jgi:hypothetical protein